MPGQKLEKTPPIQLLKIMNRVGGDLPQNNSHQQLVRAGEDAEKSFKDISLREWVTVLVLCFVNLINYMDRFTLAGILVDIENYYDINDDKSGLLQTVFIISYMIFAPIFGYLGDRYNRRLIMAAGVSLWGLTTFVGSFMSQYEWFLMCRAFVGIGEASYSTIAPTIISDLFVGSMRSKMLALFYFAIPVGSGLGYIVGSETAKALGSWQWGLRVTPALGVVAVFLIIFTLLDPQRGQSDGSEHMEPTSWQEDLKSLARNRSFILSTAGFTCVAFVAGALAWWGPKFIYLGLKLQVDGGSASLDSLPILFGCVTMAAGIVGVILGCVLSAMLKKSWPRVDPIICAAGLFLSAPLMLGATYATTHNTVLMYFLLFLGEVALNLNWSIVCDISLYVVLPTRRSTADGFQLLVSHALGDAGSPFLIGVISESLKDKLSGGSEIISDEVQFRSLQYALFITCFVELVGGVFFLITSLFILKDKHEVDVAIHRQRTAEISNVNSNENENSSLVS